VILLFRVQGGGRYLFDRIEALAQMAGLQYTIAMGSEGIYLQLDALQPFAELAERELYTSLFFHGITASHEMPDTRPPEIPASIAPCPRCLKEMSDPKSRRYSYPFTSCKSCSNQYAFFLQYPYKRSNTLLGAIKPCSQCQEELLSNPFRRDYPLISCPACNIPVALRDGRREFWANSSQEYKQLFSMAAQALREGKRLVVQTLNGERSFSIRPFRGAKLLIANLERAKRELLLLPQELQALFTIERPTLFATLSNEEIREAIGGSIATVRAFNDGFTYLLIRELWDHPFLYYEESGEGELSIDFPLTPNTLQESHYLISKGLSLFTQGELGLLPKYIPENLKSAVVGDHLLHQGIIDRIQRFGRVEAEEITTCEKGIVEHPRTVIKEKGEGALRSVAREHTVEDRKSIGLFFSHRWQLYYLHGERGRRVADFGDLPTNLSHSISTLREGSSKLLHTFSDRFGELPESGDFWERAGAVIGIEGGYRGVVGRAMEFGGKGGVSIDCRLREGRFEYESLFASLMSYRVGGAESTLLAYSLLESLADFFSQLMGEVGRDLEVEEYLLAGKYAANTPFLSRFLRNIPSLKMNRAYPADGYNCLYGITS